MIQDPDLCNRDTVGLSNKSTNSEFTSDLSRSSPEIQPATSATNDLELLDIGPDIQSDPDKMEPQACSQPGTNLLIVSALTPDMGYLLNMQEIYI